MEYQGIGRRLLMVDELPPVFPVRQDITVLPADGNRRLALNWTISEEIGITVINDSAITRVNFEVDTLGYCGRVLRSGKSKGRNKNVFKWQKDLEYVNPI